MQVVVIDQKPDSRSGLVGRVQEGLRQAALRRVEIVDVDEAGALALEWSGVIGCLIGPTSSENLDRILQLISQKSLKVVVAVVLEVQVYAAQAVNLRRRLNIEVLPINDLAQIATFLLSCEQAVVGKKGRHRGVISVTQFKGGVGTTSIAAGIASCWAKGGVSVALVDLDDVSSALTRWARCSAQSRAVISEWVTRGEVPPQRIREVCTPIEGEDLMVVVGMPQRYQDRFRFKADLADSSPGAALFLDSLLEQLRGMFDVVLMDLGRSWGVASFAALSASEHVLLVTDDDALSVRTSLDCLQEMQRESGDPQEFDLARWTVVLNAYTGMLLSEEDVEREVHAMGVLSKSTHLFTVPFSPVGRQWGAPSKTLFDMAEPATKKAIFDLANFLIAMHGSGVVAPRAGLFARMFKKSASGKAEAPAEAPAQPAAKAPAAKAPAAKVPSGRAPASAAFARPGAGAAKPAPGSAPKAPGAPAAGAARPAAPRPAAPGTPPQRPPPKR